MNLKTRLEIVIVTGLLLLSSLVQSNIVELNNFRLAPFVLIKKQDFTYSSGFRDEDYAAVRFDLAMTP